VPYNGLDQYINRWTKQYTALMDRIRLEIMAEISRQGPTADISAIVRAVFQKYGVTEKLQTYLEQAVVGGLKQGITISATTEAAVNWYLAGGYINKNLFSQATVANPQRLITELQNQMQLRQATAMAAQNIQDVGIISGEVAKDVQKALSAARKQFASYGDYEGWTQLNAEVRRLQKRINKLTDPSTSKLKRAYQDVIDAINSRSIKAMDKASKYALYFKERYNAERIVRTETARAYGQAFHSTNLYDPDTTAFKVVLSNRHPAYDICNVHASADLYGLGRGVYPKDKGPEYPFHPQCLCVLFPVYEAETGADVNHTPDPDKMTEYIGGLSDKSRRQLLGVEGAKAFASEPESWTQYLRNWHGHTAITPQIPIENLYR